MVAVSLFFLFLPFGNSNRVVYGFLPHVHMFILCAPSSWFYGAFLSSLSSSSLVPAFLSSYTSSFALHFSWHHRIRHHIVYHYTPPFVMHHVRFFIHVISRPPAH